MSDIHCGIHGPLERAADALIYGSLKGITSQTAKSDILTPWKDADRHRREVMARSGTVDPQLYRGIYHRVANRNQTYLNSRDGAAPARRIPRFWVEDDAPSGV